MTHYQAMTDNLSAVATSVRFQAERGPVLSRGEVLSLWKTDTSFSRFFSGSLAAAPFAAFYWETPPLTPDALNLPFECVLVSGASLARRADPTPFADHIAALCKTNDVVAFSNLGGDADLIVPCDSAAGADYAHLAAFLRTAPAAQIETLWRKLAERAETWLARGKKFWISTAGLGAPWVHVRIDSRPKYYRHTAYALNPRN